MDPNTFAGYIRGYEARFRTYFDQLEPLILRGDDLRFLASALKYEMPGPVEFTTDDSGRANERRAKCNFKFWLKQYWKSPDTEDPAEIKRELRDCLCSMEDDDKPRCGTATLVEALRRAWIEREARDVERAARAGIDETVKKRVSELYGPFGELNNWLIDKMTGKTAIQSPKKKRVRKLTRSR